LLLYNNIQELLIWEAVYTTRKNAGALFSASEKTGLEVLKKLLYLLNWKVGEKLNVPTKTKRDAFRN
jgi:hypothetical protein